MKNKPSFEQIRKVGTLEANGNEYSIRPNGSLRIRKLPSTLPSKTQQQFADSTDANKIVAKYHKNLHLERFNAHPDMYRDLSTQRDFLDAMTTVTQATSAFNSLPSTVRTRFQNDPTQLLAFIEDPNNYAEGVKLGLFKPKPSNPNDQNPNPNTKNPNPNPTKTPPSIPAPAPTES